MTKKKNDGWISRLLNVSKEEDTSIQTPNEQNKSDAVTQADLEVLLTNLDVLVKEVKTLTTVNAKLASAIYEHNLAIIDLYSVQDHILKLLEAESTTATTVMSKTSKTEKPN